MAAYFDSSVLLSLLLGDSHAQRAQQLWHAEFDRVSSILLDIECVTVLRRVTSTSLGSAQRKAVEERLTLALDEVTLKPVDGDIANLLRDTPALATCRALDAAHLATALFFRAADPDLPLCTFDSRMAEAARALGLTVLSAGSETAAR
jgi:predicted nucleic acid-binding protein